MPSSLLARSRTGLALCVALAACGPSSTAPDGSLADAAPDAVAAEVGPEAAPPDAPAPDVPMLDAAPDAPDAPAVDAVMPPAPMIVARSLSGPASIAVESLNGDAYFAQCSGELNRFDAVGNTVGSLASGQGCLADIALAGSSYFAWTSAANGTVTVARKVTGGAAVTVAMGQARPVAVAADASFVYWVNQGTGAAAGSVQRVALAGGAVTALATAQDQPQDLALDASGVYWLSAGGANSVQRVALAGGAASTLATGFGTPTSIAVYAGFVYWVAHTGAMYSVLRVPVGGGTMSTLAAGISVAGAQPSVGIAVDARGVVLALSGDPAAGDGSIVSLPLTGGALTTLATAQATPRGIALGAGTVYWTNGVGNTLARTNF